MSHRRNALLGLALVASLALTGCSDDAPKLTAKQKAAVKAANAFAAQPVEDIVRAATTATGGLTSVHFVTDGKRSGTRVVVDLDVDASGDCVGTLTQDGAIAQLRGLDGTYWIQPGVAYIRKYLAPGDDGALERLRGKWVVSPNLAATCDLKQVLDGVTSGIAAGTPTRGKRASVRGQDTVEVKDDSQGADRSSTAAVRTSEPHYVVEFGLTGSGDTGTVELSDFDVPVKVQAPPAGLVVTSVS